MLGVRLSGSKKKKGGHLETTSLGIREKETTLRVGTLHVVTALLARQPRSWGNSNLED